MFLVVLWEGYKNENTLRYRREAQYRDEVYFAKKSTKLRGYRTDHVQGYKGMRAYITDPVQERSRKKGSFY